MAITSERILSHGIGGAADLPISPQLAIAGAVAALTVSFTVLILAWRTPRYDARTSGRAAPAALAAIVEGRPFRVGLRVVGMVLFGYTAWVALWGADLLTNPLFGMFYVWWWVGLVPASLLLGPVWNAISPVRTLSAGLSRLLGVAPEVGLRDYPARWGYWPAALGLLAFVWFELVYPSSTELGAVRLWGAVYLAAMLLGGAVFGSGFFERADPFEVYSSLVAKLSVWGRRDGRLVLRSPLANLDTVQTAPGLVAVVAVLFGSTAFDSFLDTSEWVQFTQRHLEHAYLLNNLALVGFCVAAGAAFAVGCAATGVDPGTRRSTLPGLFAHSVVPIIVGYVVAHYLSYFVVVSQLTLIQVSDPLSTGANLFGTGDLAVNYWLSERPTLLASTKVLAVIAGHVLGVIAAHDRAIRILPSRHQVTGQLPLLAAMIGFTAGGLYLLFAA